MVVFFFFLWPNLNIIFVSILPTVSLSSGLFCESLLEFFFLFRFDSSSFFFFLFSFFAVHHYVALYSYFIFYISFAHSFYKSIVVAVVGRSGRSFLFSLICLPSFFGVSFVCCVGVVQWLSLRCILMTVFCVSFSLFFLSIQIFERDRTARDLWDSASAWAAAAVAIATAIATRAAMVQSMVADQLTTTITTCSSSRTTIIASRTLLLLLLVVVIIIIIIITILHHRHIIIILLRHLLRRLKARDRRTCPFPWRYLSIATTIRTSRTDRSCTVTTTKTRRTCLKKVKTIKNILIRQVVFDNKKIIMINWHGKQSQRDWAPA